MSGEELDKLAEQLSPTPSLTVTIPVGVRMSPVGGVTEKLTVTGCPTTTEPGEIERIVVVVLALITV
jgi:hypothetical protein